MFCLCSWAAADTSVALTGERTTALSLKYICRGKSSVSNVRKSQLTLQTGSPYQDEISATYSHLPSSPVPSIPLGESGSSRRGSRWWICQFLTVFHAFTQEGRQSPQSSFENLARESTSPTPGLTQTSLPHSSKKQAQCEMRAIWACLTSDRPGRTMSQQIQGAIRLLQS